MDLFLLLSQVVPNSDDLKSGDAQTILVWIIGALLAALVAQTTYLLKIIKEHKEEAKEWLAAKDDSQKKMMRLALRVQKALEVWAQVEVDKSLIDEDTNED